jgi:hypothetical protein
VALFAAAPSAAVLTVVREGTGGGRVVSAPAGNSCPADCAKAFAAGTTLTLTATPDQGSTFAGFSGACTGTTCTVTPAAAAQVRARFDAAAAAASPPPPPPPAAVAPQQIEPKQQRLVRVRLASRRRVAVLIRVVRGKKTLVQRRIARFGPARRTIALSVPARVKAGRAQLVVRLTAPGRRPSASTRGIRIP